MQTAYHALSFTTLLLRRWLLYYSLLPSLIRLVALQAICWPLVRLTLYVAGPDEPTGAWVLVGTTTALSDTVARWVTSNLADVDESPDVANSTTAEDATVLAQQKQQSSQQRQSYESRARAGRRQIEGRQQRGTAFWRAVVGGPSDSSTSAAWHEGESNARTDSPSGSNSNSDDSGYVGQGREAEDHEGDEEEDEEHQQQQLELELELEEHKTVVRRVFHWDVAMRRNVLPIALLGYLTMWSLILQRMAAARSVPQQTLY